MDKKLGKNVKLDFDCFNVIYGTINYLDPKTIDIKIESWVEPNEVVNFNKSMLKTIRYIKYCVNDYIKKTNKDFYEHIIVDYDLRYNSLKTNKKSFLCITIVLYPKIKHNIKSIYFKNEINNIVTNVINTIKLNNNFNFKKTKK